jgi:hypothetical protein
MLSKSEAWSAGFKASWKGRYPAPGIASRVSGRLRWDKMLADVPIEVVQIQAGEVELRGTVTHPDQKRRALELAESTAGVDRVADSLQFAEAPPAPTPEAPPPDVPSPETPASETP